MMSPYLVATLFFGAILLGGMWFLPKLIGGTQYIARRTDDPPGDINALRENRKRETVKKITTLGMVWLFACLGTFLLIWMVPRVQAVKAALGPSATPTITATPTLTRTPRPTWTSTKTATLGTPGTALTTTATTGTPQGSVTASPTATARIVYQSVVQTQIVVQTKIVQVPVTVIVIVTATPTYTPSPTLQIPVTETATGTGTATSTDVPTFTPTETATEVLP